MQRRGSGDEDVETHGVEPRRVQVMRDDESPVGERSDDDRGRRSEGQDPDTRIRLRADGAQWDARGSNPHPSA